ncbi:MAG: ATP-binding protein [Bacteroidales bacterium]|nr:ATP-binding protein [Bacteroidales bacterium]
MERIFNVAGPNKPNMEYTIDPLARVDLDEVLNLINQNKYFVLHAPRQTGKTSMLLALRDYLNKEGKYFCVYANIEPAQAARNNVASAVGCCCEIIADEIDLILDTNKYTKIYEAEFKDKEENTRLRMFLTFVSKDLGKPFILFIDEIDAVVGDSLVSILRQLRSGYDKRPDHFPQSIILCGVRDVRDYRIVLSNQDVITGGSAFNIKTTSLRMGNFTKDEIRALYQQHTDETGQVFDEECFPMIWNATEGQPWLVNAIGNEVTYKMKENRDRSIKIIPEMIFKAKENLIYRRDTHLDILIDRLKEDRVRRIIQPLLAADEDADERNFPTDDLQYCIDLGLIAPTKPVRIANEIYREIIPRELTWTTQYTITQEPAWYLNPDNSINMEKLLIDFQQFFRQNADSWIGKFDYAEAGPQLLLQAFLQRIVNGGGYIDREYGIGRGRTDLLIRKPLTNTYGGAYQRIVLELKIRKYSIEKTIENGLKQTYEYMDKVGDVSEGHFITFDRTNGKPWDEKIFHREAEFNGRKIMIWGM